ncbi:FadR/GntR family transcriptional regulator [Streptantibioticus rubrisoli]|uniref:FadR/GntR family transcriptional regulator n=1 Tax=Streptantibioticus rubrisoli TaxID=1387313 RepID=UPI003555F4C9
MQYSTATLLLERIRGGEWALGAKLPGETTLGPQLGVGRSTVREAIRQLAGKGVLESRQGAGVFVIALDVPDQWDDVLKRSDIVAVIEARIAIESAAAALAAQRRTPTDLRALRRALDQRAGAYGSIDTLVDADTAFHRHVVVAAHNEILTGQAIENSSTPSPARIHRPPPRTPGNISAHSRQGSPDMFTVQEVGAPQQQSGRRSIAGTTKGNLPLQLSPLPRHSPTPRHLRGSRC